MVKKAFAMAAAGRAIIWAAPGGQLLTAMGSRYRYNALAREKTGDFWVNSKLFGRQTCHTTEDVEHADYLLVIGANQRIRHTVFPMHVIRSNTSRTTRSGRWWWSIRAKPGRENGRHSPAAASGTDAG